MKNKILASVLLAIVAISAVSVGVSFVNNTVDGQLPPMTFYEVKGPISKPDIALDEGVTLPDTPDKMMVYKVKSPMVTAEKVVALAETLRLGNNITENDKKFIVRDDSIELEVLKASGRKGYME